MATQGVTRRLAAILAADVVGYGRLMERDEEGTHAALAANRAIIDGLIEDRAGRVFHTAGDSVIAEFASPVEAVRAAVEVQLALDKATAEVPEDRRMRLRIGVHLGDVMVDGEDLIGDGVIVAARLEGLAPPGGLCLSNTVIDQVRDRLGLDFLDLGEHRVKNIARPVQVYRVPLASEARTTSPFRGLDVFEFEHADIFHGRGGAIAAAQARLEGQATAGTAFLLIYGMSGSGKSSLLRAGLVPAVCAPGAVPGIALWRHAVVRPSEGADPFAAVARGLAGQAALPALADAPDLAALLRDRPDRALGLIRGGLAGEAEAAPSAARLILGIDQLEELFTGHADATAQAAFVRLLTTLASSGLVWVVATMRGDFFHRCAEVPGLAALKDGLGNYELLAPTGPEIAQMIREPARAAGLTFEQDPSQGRLDDVLQQAAMGDPASLPLLEFVLDALYEAGKESRRLTFAAYRALGGRDGRSGVAAAARVRARRALRGRQGEPPPDVRGLPRPRRPRRGDRAACRRSRQ